MPEAPQNMLPRPDLLETGPGYLNRHPKHSRAKASANAGKGCDHRAQKKSPPTEFPKIHILPPKHSSNAGSGIFRANQLIQKS